MLATAIAAFAFAACSDVPEPYPTPSKGNGEDLQEETLGTLESPLTIDQALAEFDNLADGGKSQMEAIVKGKVSRNITSAANFAQYFNINYYISEDGTQNGKEIEVYKGMGMNNEIFSAVTDIKQGDEVIVRGKLYKYKNNNTGAIIPEIEGGYLLSYTPSSNSGGTTSGEFGTSESPLTVEKAMEICNGLADNGTVSPAYVKGKISKVQSYNNTYKSITYYISDDGTNANALQVYSGKGIDGADFAAQTDLEVGWTVIVTGELKKYVNANGAVTLEINQSSQIVSIDKTTGGGGDTPTPSGDSYTLATSVTDGEYAIATVKEGSTYVLAQALTSGYGYLKTSDATFADNAVSPVAANNSFSIKTTTGGYTIQDADGQYIYMTGTYNSFNRSADMPSEGAVWTISIATDGAATIKNASTGKTIQYSAQYTSYGAYADVTNTLPCLFAKGGSSTGGGGNNGGSSYNAITSISNGRFVIGATVGATIIVATPLESSKTYGYLGKSEVTASNGAIITDAGNQFTFTSVDGGYTIQSADGRYLYMKGTYNSFNVDATAPSEGHVWAVTFNDDKTVNIKNVLTGKIIQYSTQYSSYGAYAEITNTLPVLYKK